MSLLNPTLKKTNIPGFLTLARGYNASFRKKPRLMRQSWISGTSAMKAGEPQAIGYKLQMKFSVQYRQEI